MLMFIGRHFLNKTQFQLQYKLAQNWELVWTPRAEEMKWISIFMKVRVAVLAFSEAAQRLLLIMQGLCVWAQRGEGAL